MVRGAPPTYQSTHILRLNLGTTSAVFSFWKKASQLTLSLSSELNAVVQPRPNTSVANKKGIPIRPITEPTLAAGKMLSKLVECFLLVASLSAGPKCAAQLRHSVMHCDVSNSSLLAAASFGRQLHNRIIGMCTTNVCRDRMKALFPQLRPASRSQSEA
jgi:hypothetical protein